MKKRPNVVIEPRIRITCQGRFTFGPGKAALLGQIDQTGSIAQAARTMDMSYMRAWMLVKNMNRSFAQPLVSPVRGGRQRGGATLTVAGRQVLKLYQEMEKQSLAASRSPRQKLARLLQA